MTLLTIMEKPKYSAVFAKRIEELLKEHKPADLLDLGGMLLDKKAEFTFFSRKDPSRSRIQILWSEVNLAAEVFLEEPDVWRYKVLDTLSALTQVEQVYKVK